MPEVSNAYPPGASGSGGEGGGSDGGGAKGGAKGKPDTALRQKLVAQMAQQKNGHRRLIIMVLVLPPSPSHLRNQMNKAKKKKAVFGSSIS